MEQIFQTVAWVVGGTLTFIFAFGGLGILKNYIDHLKQKYQFEGEYDVYQYKYWVKVFVDAAEQVYRKGASETVGKTPEDINREKFQMVYNAVTEKFPSLSGSVASYIIEAVVYQMNREKQNPQNSDTTLFIE